MVGKATSVDVDLQPARLPAFEARRLDLLKQAARVFAAEGYHQTSVSTLAERLGVSKPVLYYYAKNKDDLLVQIDRIAFEELRDAMGTAQAAKLSGMGKLRRFFNAYTEIMCGEFGRCFALVDHRALGPSAREQDVSSRRAIEEAVRQIIVEGQADGSVGQCDPVLAARALFGAFNGIPRWFEKGGGLVAGEVAETYFDIFAIGVGRR